ncbi:MAG: 16S rRNA (adenine(1518)-N(6)/adenine(1519)-N(6))-dimethyltransferase RsmA [Candidatus Saccharibacteria bacterium]|nr:16S rRNA (adenine(1518)-N(6)/adenine(1519)-N(6))-dimethyltransferase RsmA [Candidatus Saccharibacteria bacterium]
MYNDTKKSLGQHWLNDEASLDMICQAADVSMGDMVLEIGPGQGSLTDKLVAAGANVTAVELDDDLILSLKRRFGGQPVTIVHGNILKFDLSTLPSNYKVVANIPYYLTSKLIRIMTEAANPFHDAVLLVQKEVAERVAAKAGKMSALSVATQFYCDVGLGPVIAADKFTPPPKIDSQLLLLNFSGPKFACDTKHFFQLVHAGFGERRKKLSNSLSGGLHIPKDQAEALLQAAGLSTDVRAQELTLAEWGRLYNTWRGN